MLHILISFQQTKLFLFHMKVTRVQFYLMGNIILQMFCNIFLRFNVFMLKTISNTSIMNIV